MSSTFCHNRLKAVTESQLPPSQGAGLPPEWAVLPFLALPDGVHRWDHDATFFTLPTSSWNEVRVNGFLLELMDPGSPLWRRVYSTDFLVIAETYRQCCDQKYSLKKCVCSLQAGNALTRWARVLTRTAPVWAAV